MPATRTPLAVRLARKYGQSAVLYAALALSAPGEYALAVMAGWDAEVAWLMPAVLSLYAAIGASVAKNQKEAARVARGTAGEAEAKRRSRHASFGALLALLMATAAQIAEHVLTTGATGNRAWVVIIVSAVPPLVAAHVLHIDPPTELDDEPAAERVDVEQRETPPVPVSVPPTPPADLEPVEPESAPDGPVLVSYAEAAEALGRSETTIRGWANNGTVRKYPGLTSNTRRVDLVECQRVANVRPVSV